MVATERKRISLAVVVAFSLLLAGSAMAASAPSPTTSPTSTVPKKPTTTATTKPAATLTAKPLVAAISAPTSVADVARLDATARARQRALELVMKDQHTTAAQWARVANLATQAELDLNVTRDQAWRAVLLQPATSLLISEPLVLAMLDLHIEVRRALGSTFHTAVPGLVSDEGCRGDLVAERLIYTYGAAVAGPRGATAPETTEAIDALARQIACLGAAQTAALERAMTLGFETVRDHMEVHDLTTAVPAFARLVAPVQVLILDARKHRGAASRSWQWFASYGKVLDVDVAAAGWATGKLLVWNRRQGVLVGFNGCTPGKIRPDCVDFRTFLKSLQDPRALALGDCAFAGMLVRGTNSIGGDPRYTCPTQTCATPPATGKTSTSPMSTTPPTGGLTSSQRTQLQGTWPSQLKTADLTAMGGFCKAGSADMQGGPVDLGACLGEPEANPFEQNAACMVEAIGGNSTPQIGGELKGVPTGSQCRFAEGGGSTPAPAPKQPEPKQPEPKADERTWYQKLTDWATSSSGTGTSTSSGSGTSGNTGTGTSTTGSGTPPQPAAPQAQQLEEGDNVEVTDGKTSVKGQTLVDPKTGEIKHMRVEITGGTLEDAIKIVTDEVLEPDSDPLVELLDAELNSMRARQNGRDCADPTACTNECSAVGQIMTAVQACTDDLLGKLATAMGLPDKTKLVRRVDIASYPRPDGGDTSGDDLGSVCGMGDSGPAKQSAYCGLILCASEVAASSTSTGCSCGGSTVGTFRVPDMCLAYRCPDGQLPDANCQCGETGGYEPGRPPVPPLTSIDARPSLTSIGTSLMSTTAGGGETLFVIDMERGPGF